MDIAIVGMGLIGGSFAKAIKKYTDHKIYGLDINQKSIEQAKADAVIDEQTNESQLNKMDLVIVCLHPKNAIDFILNNINNFKKGSIVADSCGIKGAIVDACDRKLYDNNINFIGAHPMAGRERFGYDASLSDLYLNASMIFTLTQNTNQKAVDIFEKLCLQIGFSRVVKTNPKHHDEVIAYTSQLAHVVSNAYVKSPTLFNRNGYSAGSFLDLTRVARLDENMWTQLFLYNRDELVYQIDIILENIKKCRDAIFENDESGLREILKQGRILKEKSLEE